jgi:hypothetical protein
MHLDGKGPENQETIDTTQEKTGGKKVITFKRAIIAAGSQAVRMPFMPDDPRVVDSTCALAYRGAILDRIRLNFLSVYLEAQREPVQTHDPCPRPSR